MAGAKDRTLILLRLSAELSTKARGTRRRFMRKLVDNIRDALATTAAEFRVESQWTRIFVHSAADREQLGVLRRIPGISSFSVVESVCPATMADIVETGTALYGERVRGRSYAVRVKRAGQHPFRSADVMKTLGAALNPDARVDLTNPEVEVEIEVRDAEAYFFSGRIEGMGGLPLGVEGRALCLLSGGFDSAVAAWMMLRRGVQLDYLFLNLAGDAYERSVLGVAKVLADDWSFGTRPRLDVVDFGPVLDELRAKCQPKLWQVVLKRLMYSAANTVATGYRSQAIITGEALGQVSSQTLSNLAAIEGASRLPVFRPLIGFDKMDIVQMSRRVGTFELSSRVKEYCAIAPGKPATSAAAAETEREEAKLDPTVLGRALAARKSFDLRGLRTVDLVVDYLFTETVPAGAVVLDLRSEEDWEAWHYPESLNLESWQLAANPRALRKDTTYVVHCGQGVQAAQVAELLQREGIEAYAFRGGTEALRRSEEKSA